MKQLCWVIPFLLLTLSSGAQNFNAGLVGGLSGTQLDGDGLGGYNKLGIYAGAFVNRAINDRLSWQFEMAYSQKGSRRVIKPETLDEGPWIRLQMHYIDVPLLLIWEFRDNLDVEVGISGNMLLSYNYRDLRNNLLNTNFSRFESALLLGARYQLKGKVYAFVRANYSMFSIDPNANFLPFFALVQRGTYNNVITLGLRYQLTRNNN